MGQCFMEMDFEKAGVQLVEKRRFRQHFPSERARARSKILQHAGGAKADEWARRDRRVEVSPPQFRIKRDRQWFLSEIVEIVGGDGEMRLFFQREIVKEV